MNRPLEFRAWHVPTKTMHYDIDFNPDFVTFRWDESKSDAENYKIVDNHLRREDCILMQYTGIIDRLGNKVWEGDVLRWDKLADPDEDLDDEDNQAYSAYYYVSYHNGGFCEMHVDEFDPATIDPFYLSGYSIPLGDIVVGNRYEHPHLMQLTGEQTLATQLIETASCPIQSN